MRESRRSLGGLIDRSARDERHGKYKKGGKSPRVGEAQRLLKQSTPMVPKPQCQVLR